MQRSHLATLITTIVAATVLALGAGCGGGGGTSGGSSGGGSRPVGTIFSQQVVGTASGSSAARSLANLVVGDIVTLRSLALYTSGSGYEGGYYEAVTDVVLTADPSVATLEGTSLHAVGTGTGSLTMIGANGVALGPIAFTVSSGRASVAGKVRGYITGTNNAGVATATARFLDSSGNTVAEVPTGPDGSFQANVPPDAAFYVVDFSSLPNTFYNQFTFNALDYTATVTNCGVPLSSLSAGSSLSLDDAIAYRKGGSNPPPPPPSGCVG